MMKLLKAAGVAALVLAPVSAHALTEAEMLALAASKSACGSGSITGVRPDPTSAGRILVSCTVPGGLEGGFAGGGAAAAGAVALVAVAIAAGGSSSGTNSTSGTP